MRQREREKKYGVEIKKGGGHRGDASGAKHSDGKICSRNKRMAGLPGRLREHSNPLLKFVLEVKKWPGSRGGSGSTAILY